MIVFEETYKTTINMTTAAINNNNSTNATISSTGNPVITNITNSEVLILLLTDLKQTFNQLLTSLEQSVRTLQQLLYVINLKILCY